MNMTNRVLEVGRNWLGVMALALCLTGSARAQVGALVDQPGTQEAEGNVVIEINNTVGDTDDVLGISESLPCRVYLTGAQVDMKVVLVVPPISSQNSSKRLSLSAPNVTPNSDGSLTTTLSKSGASYNFYISGSSGSDAVKDAVLEAHKDTAAGTVKKTASASVYWFKNYEMTVVANSNYGTFTTGGADDQTKFVVKPAIDPGVKLIAKIELMPSKSLGNAPQLIFKKVAVVQNVLSAGMSASWNRPQSTGEPFQVESIRTITTTLLGQRDDVMLGKNGPTYDTPQSLTVGQEETEDSPEASTFMFRYRTVKVDNVDRIVKYQLNSINYNGSFINWCAIYNTAISNPYNAVFTQQSPNAGWTLNAGSIGNNPAIPNSAYGYTVLTTDPAQFANNSIIESAPVFSGAMVTVPTPTPTP